VTLHTAALVGHDIGLMVAYAYAAQYPGEVSKVVLMDAFLPGVGDWKSVWLMRDLWHFHFHGETPLTEARRPHIVYPGRDMTIALDPDIPAERQRLYPRAEPALPGLAWQIDRVPSISAARHIASGLAAGAGPASSQIGGYEWLLMLSRSNLSFSRTVTKL